jgi:Conserved TM helix
MVFADVLDRMQEAISVFFAWLPSLLGALAILVIGYIVAKILGNIVGPCPATRGIRPDASLWAGGHLDRQGDVESVTAARPHHVLGRLDRRDLARRDGARDRRAERIRRGDLLVPAERADGARGRRRRTRPADDGRHGAREDREHGRPGHHHGDRRIHDPRRPRDREHDCHDHVRGAHGLDRGLGMALAFGLGGREVAAQMLQDAYELGQANSAQWKRDWEQGREQARRDAERVKAEARDRAEGDDLAVRGDTTQVVTPNQRRDVPVEPTRPSRP